MSSLVSTIRTNTYTFVEFSERFVDLLASQNWTRQHQKVSMGAEHSKQQKNGDSAPPPYKAGSKSQASFEKRRQYPEIKASDVPQWKWNNVQCQEWLTVAIMEYCCHCEKKAEKKARSFLRGGFAPLLYAASYTVWESHLGRKDAPAIYSFLIAHKSSVVPFGTRLGFDFY